jgi:hypothetical protein
MQAMTPRARAVLSSLAVVVLFALPLLPEIVGTRRLMFRDALVTHWPWRRVAVAALSSGEVPFVNEFASGGQPLLANPNAALLYPTLLLEKVLPAASAFNLHYLLHVLWAFFGARALARRLRLPEGAAFLAGVAYAFSGMMLSYASAFLNSGAAAAWLPWCAAAAVDLARAPDRRARLSAAAAAGLALGLQLLAGEPAITALTVLAIGTLALAVSWTVSPEGRPRRLGALLGGGALAGAIALALAAPLLLPLSRVFPLTLRGQHLYSKSAFGAAPFTPWRVFEWLLPRFRGDPGLPGGETAWLHEAGSEPFVYIWCVTLGVAPLLLFALAALRREFWSRRNAVLAGAGLLTLLLSFGFALPLYGLLYEAPLLRKLRYPIKFYLLTTLCAALLAGLAGAVLSKRRAGRREAALLALALAFFAAAWVASGHGGPLDRRAVVQFGSQIDYYAPIVEAFRQILRGDAIFGALTVAVLAVLLRWKAGGEDRGYAFGFATLLLALPWALPLFAWAPTAELDRPPALLPRLEGAGRLYVPSQARLSFEALEPAYPKKLPRASAVARMRIERLYPLTGASFGVRSLFETDPDGSYGYYNRIASEAAAAAPPLERDRLLRAYGARWAIAPEGEEYPLRRAVTGFSVAGERLVLFEDPGAVEELRWAGRAYRRRSLSGTIDLLRSAQFDPATDIALPGREDSDPPEPPSAARLKGSEVRSDRARAGIEAAGAGFLVFSRTYFPAWKARLDGAPAPVLVANARDLAVAVPAGTHSIELEYDRAPFRAGVALQAAGFLLAAGLAIACRPRRSLARP